MTKQDQIKAQRAAKQLMKSFRRLKTLALSDPDKAKGQSVAANIAKMESIIQKASKSGDSKTILQFINQLSS